MTDKAAERIQTAIWWLTCANVLIYLAFALGGYAIWRDAASKRSDLRAAQADLRRDEHDLAQAQAALRREEARTTRALCAQRADVNAQIASTNNFLATNPNGIPGIPTPTILANLARQVRFAATLRFLQCPPGTG